MRRAVEELPTEAVGAVVVGLPLSVADAAAAAARRRRGKRTQEERSAEMRRRLQEAAVECLKDLGYADLTLSSVARRAGVSLGAVQHHYPGKAFLVASALEMLTTNVTFSAGAEAADLMREPQPPSEVLDRLWAIVITMPFPCAVDIRVAARTDPELRAMIIDREEQLRPRQYQMLRDALGPELTGATDFERRVDGLLALMRGLSMLLYYEGRDPGEVADIWALARDSFIAELGRNA